MTFVFTRVDERAIHGQTVTLWSKIYQNDGIILVDDQIAQDDRMRQIYKNAAIGTSVYIFTQEQALTKAKQAAESQKRYLLIARTPLVLSYLHKGGVAIGTKINLGPVSQNDNRKLLAQFTALSTEEIQACDYLAAEGKDVAIQNVPSSNLVAWHSISRKE